MGPEKLDTVFGFVALFTIIEPVLVRLCGPSRNGNLFCIPSYDAGDLASYWEKITDLFLVYGLEARRRWSYRGKYASLNIDPLNSLNSVEVRCFPNSITPSEIMKWVDWLMEIKRVAQQWEDRTFFTMIDRASNDPGYFLHLVFPDESLFSACYPNNPNELIQCGIEQA